MNRHQRRAAARFVEKRNLEYPACLMRIPVETWPSNAERGRIEVWRSRDFLVQVFAEEGGICRISVNRCKIAGFIGEKAQWHDDISWDDLQRIKAECGRGDQYAVEIYPAQQDVVNVANMRHLWVLKEPPVFAWRKESKHAS